jgi:acyl-CoA reductase-like NAD-dependent aldehyde dehydrogenase
MLDKRKFYINGEWVDPVTKNDLDVINPRTKASARLFLLALKLIPT